MASGVVTSINISDRKGVRKLPGVTGTLIAGRGLAKDAHAAEWHRQISLLAQESIDKMSALGLSVGPGDFAENITTSGLDLLSLPVGTELGIGQTARVEITQIGKECHARCAIYYQAGDCVMPKEGVFAAVKVGGEIRVGDRICVISPETSPEESAEESSETSAKTSG